MYSSVRKASGKSTIAKIISFCSWLEKVNEATDRAAVDGLIKRLGKFHQWNYPIVHYSR